LAEEEQKERICRIRPRKLHVIDELVRGDSLQNELASVAIFSLVTFQGDIQKPYPNEHEEEDDHAEERDAKPSGRSPS
jgi:hypothetical protein